MKIISLLTDFGTRDGYTGVMKGVIYGIAPDAQIADISHSIGPQNVLEGSLVWKRAYTFFPEGSVHVGVVDPGVGTQRRPVAARIGSYFFVCPDNGLLTLIIEEAEDKGQPVEIVHLDQPRFWLQTVSNVFHGRDIFSPVAAHIANGTALTELGTPINDPVRMDMPKPEKIEQGWRGQVISVDHFGNLRTNLVQAHLQEIEEPIRVRIAGKEIKGLSTTFGEEPEGTLIALFDSDDDLAVSVVGGNAAREIGAEIGTQIEVVRGK